MRFCDLEMCFRDLEIRFWDLGIIFWYIDIRFCDLEINFSHIENCFAKFEISWNRELRARSSFSQRRPFQRNGGSRHSRHSKTFVRALRAREARFIWYMVVLKREQPRVRIFEQPMIALQFFALFATLRHTGVHS